jgi:3-hydroxybutyryl-CoA dehydrogenase
MGQGIALVAATAGAEVLVYDVNEQVLANAQEKIEDFTQKGVERGKMTAAQRLDLLNRIEYTVHVHELVGPLMIEAIPEKLEYKQDLFRQLEAQNAADSIFATNTSSIPVTQIAGGLQRPERVVGMHFFNPAPLMQLVEVIAAEATDPGVVAQIIQLCRSWGKTPAVVKDTPGFIVNRVARHYYLESLELVEAGIGGVETVDKLLENAGFRMGPFRLMDLIGVNTNHRVSESLYEQFYQAPRFRPSRLQQKKVEAGHWGQKSGKGFYDYREA